MFQKWGGSHMAKLLLSCFLLLFITFGLSFTLSFQQLNVVDSDNESSVENSTRNAMTQAINLGASRVNEEITINEEIAVEAVVRQYADSQSFAQGDRYLNIYKVSSNPPMLAVESYSTIDAPFKNLINEFNGENKSTENVTRSREVQIIEAKDVTR